MVKYDFIKLFAIPELKSIAGNRYRNLVVLVFMIMITLFAIGLGISSIEYLRVKMDNPFVKFIKINIPYEATISTTDIENLKDSKIKTRYKFGEVSDAYLDYLTIISSTEQSLQSRCIKEEEELFQFIKSSSILVTNNTYANNVNGCVITEDVYNSLNTLDKELGYLKIKKYGTAFSIPICGVVKSLPDDIQIIITDKLFSSIRSELVWDNKHDNHNNYLKIIVSPEVPFNEPGFKEVNNESFTEAKAFINLNVTNPTELFNKIDLKIENKILREYELDRIPSDFNISNKKRDYLTVSFYSLDSIKPFQEFMKKNFKLTIDMNTIESKENFKFFDKLSKMLSISLILFSIISISFFVTNIIISHIEKNKKNLGTLKAFGLSNSIIIAMYSLISGVIILFAFILGYLITILIGQPILSLLYIATGLNTNDTSVNFQLYSFVILVSIFTIIPILLVFFKLKLNLKNSTPGDLIYERN